MDNLLKFGFDFILMFAIFYIVCTVFFNKKRKEYKKLPDNDYLKMFIARNNLDMRKTNYKKLLNITTIINCFIVAFTSTLLLNIKGILLKIAVCFVVVFVLIYALYSILGRILKNKENKKNV